MKEYIIIQTNIDTWQEYNVEVPDGMSKEEFVQHLMENDPDAGGFENTGIEYITDTEEPIAVEYHDMEMNLLGEHQYTHNNMFIVFGERAVNIIEEEGFDTFLNDLDAKNFHIDHNVAEFNPNDPHMLYQAFEAMSGYERWIEITREEYEQYQNQITKGL